jgi:hypothetical protein
LRSIAVRRRRRICDERSDWNRESGSPDAHTASSASWPISAAIEPPHVASFSAQQRSPRRTTIHQARQQPCDGSTLLIDEGTDEAGLDQVEDIRGDTST